MVVALKVNAEAMVIECVISIGLHPTFCKNLAATNRIERPGSDSDSWLQYSVERNLDNSINSLAVGNIR